MMTVRLKGCPRCGGDMTYEVDIYGPFRQCLQCSYLEDLPAEATPVAADNHQEAPEREAVAFEKVSAAKEASYVG
ncbi:MAG: hypothetical protein ACUVV3_03700 [Dehalococcoidia bacterium]